MLKNFLINRIIIHEVHKRVISDQPGKIVFGNELVSLPPDGITTLRDRIVNALGSDSHCIELTIEKKDTSSLFSISKSLLSTTDKNTFIESSKNCAVLLQDAQSSLQIPGGILVVIDGSTSNSKLPFLCYIKAETHEGFLEQKRSGSITLSYLSDLLLTPQQKLYKIGFFIENNRSTDNYSTFVYDHNMTRLETKQAAKYFYQSFMGCSLSPSEKKLTQDFYTLTKDFINDLPITEQERLDLNYGLYTYLKVSTSSLISISDFAKDFVQPELRDPYSNYMKQNNFPTISINKDITYIKNKLRNRTIHFTNNVKIIAPSSDFSNLVSIEKEDNGFTLIKVNGKVKCHD